MDFPLVTPGWQATAKPVQKMARKQIPLEILKGFVTGHDPGTLWAAYRKRRKINLGFTGRGKTHSRDDSCVL